MKDIYRKVSGYQPGSERNFPEPRPTIQHERPIGPERKRGFLENVARDISTRLDSPQERARQPTRTTRTRKSSGGRSPAKRGRGRSRSGSEPSFQSFIPSGMSFNPSSQGRDAESIFGAPDWASPGYIPPGMRRFF